MSWGCVQWRGYEEFWNEMLHNVATVMISSHVFWMRNACVLLDWDELGVCANEEDTMKFCNWNVSWWELQCCNLDGRFPCVLNVQCKCFFGLRWAGDVRKWRWHYETLKWNVAPWDLDRWMTAQGRWEEQWRRLRWGLACNWCLYVWQDLAWGEISQYKGLIWRLWIPGTERGWWMRCCSNTPMSLWWTTHCLQPWMVSHRLIFSFLFPWASDSHIR